ncbi:MAG: restriction endonuclease subunit S [Bacteroidales bacterium]|nr:restriction endonuclease subunit S [Bacteroidales bacterium]
MMQSKTTWIPLGQLISPSDERNSKGKYNESHVRGISVDKKIIPTRANLDGVSLTPYKVFKPKEFAFVTVTSRNGDKITITINDTDETFIVSSLYVVFRVKDESIILPEYLYIYFNRKEFDRYCRTNSWGSAREYFWYDDICRTPIPVPTIDKQKEIIKVYKETIQLRDTNLNIAEPLLRLCRSYIQELKNKMPLVPIGPYISKGEKNTSKEISRVLGVGQSGFITPQKTPNESLSNYKIMDYNAICYAPPLYNILSDAIHLYKEQTRAVCSPIYEVFYCNEEIIVPEFLLLWLKRPEFKRYAEFHAMGVRNTFNYNLMEEVKIPLPPIETQQAIVDIYTCASKAKQIAEEADKLSREICPALIQKVIHD